MYLQEKIGAWFRAHIDLGILEKIDIEGTLPLVNQTVNLANFTMGVCLTAIFMGIIAYPIVYLIYALTPKHQSSPATKPPIYPTDKI